MNLPIYSYKRGIQYNLLNYQVFILVGETGSGKSTQLPQYAQEFLGGKIICTQPRRIAARTLAERVANEMKCPLGDFVGFIHRNNNCTSTNIRITFMTEGVLVKQFAQLLSIPNKKMDINCVILDEAHERSVDMDILLGALKIYTRKNRKLRVIITSATINARIFSDFFGGVPIQSIPGRNYEVSIQYQYPGHDCEHNYPSVIASIVREKYRVGDILVFLPGEYEINIVIENLKIQDDLPLEILPLYGSLEASQKKKVFESYHNTKVICATSIAETSITIDGIVVVIDLGFSRRNYFINGVDSLVTEICSQTEADQRKGRAGRTSFITILETYFFTTFHGPT